MQTVSLMEIVESAILRHNNCPMSQAIELALYEITAQYGEGSAEAAMAGLYAAVNETITIESN